MTTPRTTAPTVGCIRRSWAARALCSGPGKLTEALGITHRHNALALDAPPFALYARTGKLDVASGVRIGITKAVELPWRYGQRGSKFLSKPFAH